MKDKPDGKAPAAEIPSTSQDGHAVNPGGANQLYGIETDTGAGYSSPELAFMTAHVTDMARLLAEGVYTKEELSDMIHGEWTRQASLGRVNLMDIIRLRMAGSIGLDGRGREDGVRVATMSGGGLMAKARSLMSRMFGSGTPSGADAPPPTDGRGFNG